LSSVSSHLLQHPLLSFVSLYPPLQRFQRLIFDARYLQIRYSYAAFQVLSGLSAQLKGERQQVGRLQVDVKAVQKAF
jgi:hypothetical protein